MTPVRTSVRSSEVERFHWLVRLAAFMLGVLAAIATLALALGA